MPPPRPLATRRPPIASALTLVAILLSAGTARSQPLPYQATPSYQARAGDPYGINYNWDYMRYGLPGVGVSPWNPIVQAQLNLGMRTARYDMYNAWSAQSYQAANLYNQRAIAQALENQRQMQAMEPRYDVRNRTPRTPQSSDRPDPTPLPRNQVISPDGVILWPAKAPSDGNLAKPRSAAEEAVRIAVKEFEASGKASVQSVVEAKERLYTYGRPAIQELAKQDRPGAESLFHFLASLERVLNSLAGV